MCKINSNSIKSWFRLCESWTLHDFVFICVLWACVFLPSELTIECCSPLEVEHEFGILYVSGELCKKIKTFKQAGEKEQCLIRKIDINATTAAAKLVDYVHKMLCIWQCYEMYWRARYAMHMPWMRMYSYMW